MSNTLAGMIMPRFVLSLPTAPDKLEHSELPAHLVDARRHEKLDQSAHRNVNYNSILVRRSSVS